MADTTTANIGLLIADLNDVFNFGAHVEANFTAIDGLMGAVDCTSAGRPTTTYKGQIAFEHDTGRYIQNTGTKASPVWTYMSHTALYGNSSAHPTGGLSNGELYFESDTKRLVVRDGSAWAPVGSTISAAPTSTTSNGTASSGSTETMDTVLGTYQFTAIAGRRYEARLNSLIGNGAANDVYMVRIRDSGSAATPTASSTLVAENGWSCQAGGTGGRTPIPLAGTFIAGSSGTHTLAFFSVRAVGTGTFTPLAPAGANGVGDRELFVVDLGAAV